MKMSRGWVWMILFGAVCSVGAQKFEDDFKTLDSSVWTKVDRGECSVRDGVLAVKDCYVHAGDLSWKNYSLEFKARAPEDADAVRIFAGFRFNSDQNRYVFGLRGGNNNDLFLARYGDRNQHVFLGVSPLGFIPQKGVWYTIRIEVAGSSIQVFLNDEPAARLTATDPEAPFETGKIALGGGWSKTEFDSVKVSPLEAYIVHDEALRYNFQSLEEAPVPGWIPVDGSRYTQEKGIGWNSDGLLPQKRTLNTDPLRDSRVGFSEPGEKVLLVDLPDGDYIVSLNMGDPAYRSQNRIYFMDEFEAGIDTLSAKGKNHVLHHSVTTFYGHLRLRFELDTPDHHVSLNWLTIEPRKLAGEAAWNRYLSGATKHTALEKEALRKAQRAAYQPLRIETPQDGRTTTSLNGDWLFLPDYEVGQHQPWDVKMDDSSWHILDVPNFWTPMLSWNYSEGAGTSKGRGSKNLWEIETTRCAAYTFDAPRTKTGYYRHTLILPDNLNGKTVQINFDAIGRESQVWVNGKSVAEYTGMFAPVRADITKWVHPGENVVVVRAGDSLKNEEYNTRDIGRAPLHMFFLENRGIWQNVSLEISDSLTIDDTFFKPHLNRFDLDVTVNNRSDSPMEYKLAAQIRDHASNRLVYDAQATRTRLMTEGGEAASTTLRSDDKTHAPFKNWSPEFPNLYRAEIFAFNYNQDPAVDLKSFSDQAMVFQGLEDDVFSTALPKGDYVVTLEFGDATQPSLAEAYVGRDESTIERAIVRDFCDKGEFITVLQSLTVTNGILEITIPQLTKPGAPTVVNRLVIEKRSEVSPAKWNLGLNHFNVLDNVAYNAGFRTFAVDGDNLVLNGKPFKLRGATLTPNLVRPNDKPLAEWFMKTLHENNISVAKNHACPFNTTWFNAADEAGVGLSQEGIWVWLMLLDKGIPNDAMLTIWKNEYIALMNKQKNHPSLLWLTHNSEMKLWLSHEPKRYEIHSEAVKEFRKVDPTRPVVADTGYSRGYLRSHRLGEKLPGIDDGDIDDTHTFHNWYDEKNFFFLRDGKSYFHSTRTPGRPYTSNEFATGYPDADTGHAIKHYIYQHMTPQALVGKWCYEDRDPKYWLNWLALVNKESHESIRTAYRDTSAGMMLFAMGTWFQNLYDVKTIKPYPTLATVAQALEPVMVSAQLGGRHFYASSSHTVNSVVVNDSPVYETLNNIRVDWEVIYHGKALSSGTKNYSGTLEYYKNKDEALTFTMPATLPQPRMNAKLVLKLHANGRAISTNTYDIVVADQSFMNNAASLRVGYFTQDDRLFPILSRLGVKLVPVKDLTKLDAKTMDVLVVADLTSKPDGYENILRFAEAGGKVLLSNNKDFPIKLLPDELTGSTDLSKQIVTPCAYEKAVFDGIEPDDMRWFTETETWKESPVRGHVPIACRSAYNVNDLPNVIRLAETTKIHGYYNRESETFHPRHTYDQVHGYPLAEIRKGKGRIIVSSMCLDAEQDPIAGKLLANLLDDLTGE